MVNNKKRKNYKDAKAIRYRNAKYLYNLSLKSEISVDYYVDMMPVEISICSFLLA